MDHPSGDVLSNEYVAGLFDGEGCVTSQMQWVKGKYEKYPRVHLRLSITNNSIRIMELLEEWFGGGSRKKQKNKDCYHWLVIGKKEMLRFLNYIKDFVIIKRDQVDLAIKFAETLRDENLGCVPLSKETHDLRFFIHNRLRELKHEH